MSAFTTGAALSERPSDLSKNESAELPTPIVFVSDGSIKENYVFLDAISFELSDANPAQTYLIAEGYEDLIFSFKNVSAPINFSLKTQDGNWHRAGFSGNTNTVLIKIDSNSENEFEWSRGFKDLDITHKETGLTEIPFEMEIVDYSSGLLEIYQVIN